MILNFDPQFTEASKILNNVFYVNDKKNVTLEQYSHTIGIVVRLGTVLEKEFLRKFKQLLFVATITTGLDHIDITHCENNNIKIISLKGESEFLENIRATPELAWGLLLSLVRKLPWAFQSVCNGNWNRQEFFGCELYKKCLGVLGFGRVGKILTRYASAFGMDTIACDSHYVDENRFCVKQVSSKTVIKMADVIAVCLPLNETTRHFLKKKDFELMKPNAVVINTSRGAIIDETALLYALEKKRIAGAALDVLEDENIEGFISKNHPLIAYANKNQNLLISPHIAGSTYDSMGKTAFFIAEKIKNFLLIRTEHI